MVPGERLVVSVAELQDAITVASVNFIELSLVGSPYVLESELTLDRNVSVSAEAGVTVDAAASEADPRRVLSVSAGAHAELHGLTLRGGWTGQGSSGGGAIGNHGTLLVSGCVVSGNFAQDSIA